MASSFHPQILQGHLLHKSHFLCPTNFTNSTPKSNFSFLPKTPFKNAFKAKFNLYEMMGGRGLCNGEEGIQQELKRSISKEEASPIPTISSSSSSGEEEQEQEQEKLVDLNISKDAFEKELLGLTGGFPGGERGLKKFIEQNPPPKI